MGVAWCIDPKDSDSRNQKDKKDKKKPILILFPGLGFGHDNMYTHAVVEKMIKLGFKCGVALFRCAHDIPITSYRVTCSSSHHDCREIIQFVNKNYVMDKKTG